mmetsp:Transcript_58383/g.137581  ORF Transcript_58383/g.137581 Transcript_58383/m.137581 type:complete len:242 (-) Transcript_58383:33-758(-)
MDFLACCASTRREPTGMDGGIGVGWERDERKDFVISKILPTGPAAESGTLRVGDKLISVDNVVPRDMEHLRQLIRGPPESLVQLSLRSTYTGETIRVQLHRRNLSNPGRAPAAFANPVHSSPTFASPAIAPPAIASPAHLSQPSPGAGPNDLYGVGLTFYLNDRQAWSVDSVQCDYEPASSIQPDDDLVTVNGADVEYSSTEEISRLVLGPRGSMVTLGFRRGQSTFAIPLGRYYRTGKSA